MDTYIFNFGRAQEHCSVDVWLYFRNFKLQKYTEYSMRNKVKYGQ